MHKQIVIIGAGPSGLLLARMLSNRGIDCLILENRNEAFFKKISRGGFLEDKIVKVLLKEKASQNLQAKGIPLKQFDFRINGESLLLSLEEKGPEKQAVIYDQSNLVLDLIESLKAEEVPIIFEAKGQRYEGLESDKVRIVYTLDGQLHDITCDYVVGCDGFRGISRRSIPRAQRTETKEELDFAWMEWIVEGEPESKAPILALHKEGFAMQSINANKQTRYYFQIERGIEKDDLPPPQTIWEELEKRLGLKTSRGKMLNIKLDYMRFFHSDLMQHGRLFIAGDAAHQVPRWGSKGLNMALADAINLAEAFNGWYNLKEKLFLDSYSNSCVAENLIKQQYTLYLNQIFHKNKKREFEAQVKEVKDLLTEENKKQKLLEFLIG